MKLRSFTVVLVAVLVPLSCAGPGAPGGGGRPGSGGDGPRGDVGSKAPDLVVQTIEVGESSRSFLGSTAVPLKIRIRNKKKGVEVPTTKPFKVSVVVHNPLLKPSITPASGDYADLAAPMGFSLIGFQTMALQGQTLPEKDLTVSVPLNPGESVLLERTIYLTFPWDLPLVNPKTGESVPMRVTVTADWTHVIQEKNESNNSKTVAFVSQ